MFDSASGYLEREMGRGTFRYHDPRQLLITGYGALLSSFSDAPILEGLVAVDAVDDAAVHQRIEHIVSFFHAALSV